MTLFFDYFDITEGSWLVIKNLGNNRIAGAYAPHRPFGSPRGNIDSMIRNIAIEKDGRLMSARHYWPGRYWWCEWCCYDLIVPTEDEWAPIPEPSTYGAVLGMLGLGIMLNRKKLRRSQLAALTV